MVRQHEMDTLYPIHLQHLPGSEMVSGSTKGRLALCECNEVLMGAATGALVECSSHHKVLLLCIQPSISTNSQQLALHIQTKCTC